MRGKFKLIRNGTSSKALLLLVFLVALIHITHQSPLYGESLSIPNISDSPETSHLYKLQPNSNQNWNDPDQKQLAGQNPIHVDVPKDDIGVDDDGGNYLLNGDRFKSEVFQNIYPSELKFHQLKGFSTLPKKRKSIRPYFEKNVGSDDYTLKLQQNSVLGEESQPQKVVPIAYLFGNQFSSSALNPNVFNQPNGLLMDKEPSDDPKWNNQMGFLGNHNEFDLYPKQVVVPSKRPHYFVVSEGSGSVNSKRNSVSPSGYMCHFKLCQLGASGKRRWSPLFEYD